MGKVKDEQLFTLLRDFLLVYLPNQRKASSNTVKAYRTALNQFLKYTAGQKNLSVLSVTSGMVTYEMVNSYLDWLSAEKNAAPATRNNRLAAIRALLVLGIYFLCRSLPSGIYQYSKWVGSYRNPKE